MNAKERETWREVRTKGEHRYVLKQGLWWALCFGAGHLLVGLISNRYLHVGWQYFVYDVVLLAAYFFLGGCLVGIWAWRRNEKEYLRPTL